MPEARRSARPRPAALRPARAGPRGATRRAVRAAQRRIGCASSRAQSSRGGGEGSRPARRTLAVSIATAGAADVGRERRAPSVAIATGCGGGAPLSHNALRTGRPRPGTCCRRRCEASTAGRCRKQSRVPLSTTVAAATPAPPPPGLPLPHMLAAGWAGLGRAEPGPAAAARRPALAPNCPLGAAGPSRDSFSSPLPPPGQWYDPLPTNAVAASTRSRPLIGRSIGGRGSFRLASRRRPLPLLEQPIREGWRAARRPIGCLLGERLETPAKGAAAAGKMAAGGGGALGEACRHHQQLGACGSRAKYREGRRPRAVKVRSEGGLAAPCGDGLRKRSEPWRSVSSR